MGLKEGSADPFADDDAQDDDGAINREQRLADVSDASVDDEASRVEPESARTETEAIPHRVKHDSPKTDRETATFVLEDDDEARIDELEALAKREFDVRVWKMDVELAALRVGLQNSDEAFLEEMRTIGYGYFD